MSFSRDFALDQLIWYMLELSIIYTVIYYIYRVAHDFHGVIWCCFNDKLNIRAKPFKEGGHQLTLMAIHGNTWLFTSQNRGSPHGPIHSGRWKTQWLCLGSPHTSRHWTWTLKSKKFIHIEPTVEWRETQSLHPAGTKSTNYVIMNPEYTCFPSPSPGTACFSRWAPSSSQILRGRLSVWRW